METNKEIDNTLDTLRDQLQNEIGRCTLEDSPLKEEYIAYAKLLGIMAN